MNTYFVWGETPDQLVDKAQYFENDGALVIASSGRAGVAAVSSDWRDHAYPTTVEHDGRLYTPTAGASELSYAMKCHARFGHGHGPSVLAVARTARRAGILKDVLAEAKAQRARWQ